MTLEEMTLAERIEKLKQDIGFVDEEADRAVDTFEGFTYGERVRVLGDEDSEGLCAGDEGHIVISTVGGAEYRNERVAIAIIVDGMDAPLEVQPDNIEPA